MAVDPVPDGVDDGVEDRRVARLLTTPSGVDHLGDRPEHLIHGRAEELFLAREVVVHGGHHDVGLLGDVADGGVDESLAGELPDRRVDDVVATRRPVRGQRRWDVALGHGLHHGRSERDDTGPCRSAPLSCHHRRHLHPPPSGPSTIAPSCRGRRRDGFVRHDPGRRGDGAGHRDRSRDDPGRRVLPLRVEGADPHRGDAAVRQSAARGDPYSQSAARRRRRSRAR